MRIDNAVSRQFNAAYAKCCCEQKPENSLPETRLMHATASQSAMPAAAHSKNEANTFADDVWQTPTKSRTATPSNINA